jgi:signal transduction histidine kinase
MASVPREDWEIVRDQINHVKDQVDELAQLHIQNKIREKVEEIIEEHQNRFLSYAAPLRSVLEKNADLSDLLHHDLLGYFALISLLIPRLKNREEDSILSMGRRVQVMKNIVEALRFYVVGEEIVPKPTYFTSWLQSYKDFFDNTFHSYDSQNKRKVSMLWFHLPNEHKHCAVLMDPSMVLLLLINLFRNAKEHGGAKYIVVSTYETNSELTLEIRDDGKGVDKNIAHRMFEGHQSTNKSFGLGLANAKERMAAMGGSIQCIPNGGLGGGAKFILTFKKSL